MDPLSLTASIITVVGVAGATIRGIEKILALKDAPEKLQDLFNEVSEVNVLVNVLKEVAPHSTYKDDNALRRLSLLLNRAERVMKDIAELIRTKLVKDPDALDDDTKTVKLRKGAWLREERKLKGLSANLSEVRQSLSAALSAFSALEAPQLRVEVQSINWRIAAMESNLIRTLEAPRVVEQHQAASSSAGPTLLLEEHYIESPTRGVPASNASSIASTPRSRSPSLESGDGVSLRVESRITNSSQTSVRFCRCDCHVPLAVTTPQWLGNAIGSLLLRYSWNSQACRNCHSKPCRKGSPQVLKTAYYFPAWLLRRKLYAQLDWDPWKGHSIFLRTPRTLSASSQVFHYAQHNNIEGMRRLFQEKLATPFDISYEEGRTPLHYAVTAEKPEMISFLIEQGALTTLEDNNALTPQDVAWNYYLQNPGNDFFEDILFAIGLTPKSTESLEKRNFTGVHLLAMGLSTQDPDEPQDLEEYLRGHALEVDRPDTFGRTPLCWAASRQDSDILETLLKWKASVLHTDRRLQTPLHYCAGSGSATNMELLLEHVKGLIKSNTHTTGSQGQDRRVTLHEIIDARDSKGRTPLNFATRMDFPQHARLLIAAGADMECADDQLHKTVLLFALYWNSHSVLPVLLRHGARTDVVDARQATLLHHAARYADFESLTIMSQHHFGFVHVHARDDSGYTASEIMDSPDQRVVRESEHRRAKSAALFTKILQDCITSVRRVRTLGHISDCSSDEDNLPVARVKSNREAGEEDDDKDENDEEDDDDFVDASEV